MKRFLQTGLVVALMAAVVGCGTTPLRAPQDRRSAGLIAGAGEGSWDAVLPGPAITEAALAAGPEAFRRNDALSHRSYDAVAALDSWPERTQPELSRWGRLYLPRDARSVIYFEQGSRDRGYDRYDHNHRGRYEGGSRYDRYSRGGY